MEKSNKNASVIATILLFIWQHGLENLGKAMIVLDVGKWIF